MGQAHEERREAPERSGGGYEFVCLWQRRRTLAKTMVQTKKGAQNNSWLEHLRRCAAEYHKSRAAEHASSAAGHASSAPDHASSVAADTSTKVKSPTKRVTGKKPDSTKAGALAKGASKPKPKGKPLEEKDTKALNTKVKVEGKKKAKKAEKEASQQKKS